jgi:exodeoxyribonuclease VII large subunit
VSQPAFDFGDDELDDAGANPTYSVGELADAINDALRRGSPTGSGCAARSPAGAIAASTPTSRWSRSPTTATAARRCQRAVLRELADAAAPAAAEAPARLADGMKVRIFGYLDYYAPNGRSG